MKLINADKVIETLRERKKLFCKNQIEFRMLPTDQKARVDEIDTCISELINAEPIDTEPHWIPVTERLPEVGKSVLICDAYGDICIGHRTRSGYYFPDFYDDKIKDVRAWCELPEPYKEATE